MCNWHNLGRQISILALMTSLVVGPAAADQSVSVATLEWPPYTSRAMPLGGAVTDIVAQAFAASDIDIEVLTLPWQRAITTTEDDAEVIAYFPGYHCRHLEGYLPSDPIGNGPLGFAEHADAPISWESIDDLGEQQLLIGTVLGYSNTDEFDQKAGTGWLKVVPAADDLTNLRKLARNRIDAAVVDRLTMAYLLATEPSLQDGKDLLVFDEKPLDEKTLYLCFKDEGEGRALRDAFNAGLSSVDVQASIERYFAEQF